MKAECPSLQLRTLHLCISGQSYHRRVLYDLFENALYLSRPYFADYFRVHLSSKTIKLSSPTTCIACVSSNRTGPWTSVNAPVELLSLKMFASTTIPIDRGKYYVRHQRPARFRVPDTLKRTIAWTVDHLVFQDSRRASIKAKASLFIIEK